MTKMTTIYDLQTIGERPRKCPQCKKMHLSDDWFCEHCLYQFYKDIKV